MNKILTTTCVLLTFFSACKTDTSQSSKPKDTADMLYYENFRPQYHFSPKSHWMNDPNGLVYHKGTYHLFYQFYPDSTVWGPMHWGHATSDNLKNWKHQPIALEPDSLGYIFSGSAVVDTQNTSGFGSIEEPPLVAMFTYHEPKGAEARTNDYQYQGIAYSLDNGKTFTKYEGNPVVPNTEGFIDFRDPKIFWYEASQKWVLILVAGDHARFYNSDNLKDWTYLSDFGQNIGVHGGVWECPDLFPLEVAETGETKWILIISINPGAPNGGSGTQYFVGEFDGETFTTDQTDEKWIDLGRDNYAGITYNNLQDDERTFIGWMSNWDYGQQVPTERWRSAMTLPRILNLHQNESYFLSNYPVASITENLKVEAPETSKQDGILTFENPSLNQSEISFSLPKPLSDFELTLGNTNGEQLVIAYNAASKEYSLDRSKSGLADFADRFAEPAMKAAAQFTTGDRATFSIFMDTASIEFFADGGANALTAVFFPQSGYTQFKLKTDASVSNITLTPIPSIWK